MQTTKDINVDLTMKGVKLKYVTTKKIDASQGSQEEDKKNIEKRRKEKKVMVSTSDIDWKKREKQENLVKARAIAKMKRQKKKT